MARFSWFVDDVTVAERDFIEVIASKASRDLGFVEGLVALPWVVDDMTEAESFIVYSVISRGIQDVEAADWAANLEWLSDGISTNERSVLLRVLRLWVLDEEQSDWVAGAAWLSDGITGMEYEDLDNIVRLANKDVESARKVASYPWFADGISGDHAAGNERSAIGFLDLLADRNSNLAQSIADLPWLIDAVSQPEAAVIHALSNIARRDVGLAGRLASLPWVRERATGEEWGTATALDQISERDVALTHYLTNLEWLADGLSRHEGYALRRLRDIATRDLALAEKVAALPWFTDDVTRYEGVALYYLNILALNDTESARELAALPWFIDGVAEPEAGVRRSLTYIASIDLQLTEEIASLPWFLDGLTRLESSAIVSLGTIAGRDVEFAREIISWPRYRDGIGRDLDFYLLFSLSRMEGRFLDDRREQSWFVDGPDDDEAVLVVVRPFQSEDLYKEILDNHRVRRETVSLPLTGEVDVWIVQHGGPLSIEDTLPEIGDAMRISEDLLGAPFPTRDVFLLVSAGEERDYGISEGNFGSHVALRSWEGELFSAADSMASYYFADNFQPHEWLVGGGAGFLGSQFNHQEGRKELSERKSELRSIVQTHCVDWGVENIRHHAYLVDNDFISVNDCSHFMGESLLHGLVEIMGKEAMSSTLDEIYAYSGGHAPTLRFSTPPTEEEIFEAFISRTSAQRQGEVRELFQRLHGGDFAFPEIDYDDAESERPTEAEDVEV